MSPLDNFYQQLDSEQLLTAHGPSLLEEAREVLDRDGRVRVAGLITTPDSPEAGVVRAMIAQMTGNTPPAGLMVGLIPRQAVEALLTKQVGTEPWHEQGWQQQQVLPVVVSTRDGHRFGLFGLGGTPERTNEM